MDYITTLNTNYWQHAAGTYGDVVCDLEDVWQCYETIMGLNKGGCPLSAEFRRKPYKGG